MPAIVPAFLILSRKDTITLSTSTKEKFWTDERLAHYQQLRDDGNSINDICDIMGITDRQARYAGEIIRRNLRRSGQMDVSGASSEAQRLTHHLDADGISSEKVMTVKDGYDLDDKALLQAHGFNPDRFMLTSATSNFWGRDNSGEPLYQTKIKVAPVGVSVDDIMAAIDRHYAENPAIDIPESKAKTTCSSGETLVIPLFDLHFGITSYDTMKSYLADIEDRLMDEYQRVVILVGGDFFHSDFMSRSMTAKVGGTQLDHVDNQEALDDGTRFFKELVNYARDYTLEVDVYAIGGNHDFDKQFMWMYSMQQYYHNDPNVNFNLTTSTRTAFKFGRVGVMVAHGDRAKRRLPMLFASEFKEIWGATDFHGIFTGHFHKELTEDEVGCVTFQVGTPKPSDNYEKQNGFVMARKKLELFVFNDERLVETIYLENHIGD